MTSVFDFMFSALQKLFRTADLAIDVGSANTRIWTRNDGLILDAPSIVVLSPDTRREAGVRLFKVGLDAKRMTGRLPLGMVVESPVAEYSRGGRQLTVQMLRHFLKEVRVGSPAGLRVIAGTRSTASSVERRGLRDMFRQAGADKVVLIDECLAIALGAGLNMDSLTATMVVDIGANATRAMIYSCFGVLGCYSRPIGGTAFDMAIARHTQFRHGIKISKHLAEEIKLDIAGAQEYGGAHEIEVRGHQVDSGLPCGARIRVTEFVEVMAEVSLQVANVVMEALRQTTPEIAADVCAQDILVSGGTASLPMLVEHLAERTGLRMRSAPPNCLIQGASIALTDRRKQGNLVITEHELDQPATATRSVGALPRKGILAERLDSSARGA